MTAGAAKAGMSARGTPILGRMESSRSRDTRRFTVSRTTKVMTAAASASTISARNGKRLARELSEDACKERTDPKTGKRETGSQACTGAAIVAKLGHPRGPRSCGERDHEPAQHARKKQKRDRIGKNEQNIADQADADGKRDCSPPTDLVRQPAEERSRNRRHRSG